MTRSGFRPTLARTQNAMKNINGTRTNATIRNIEEEEGELEEKEGTVVSIKRDLINGAGWTVEDKEGTKYICSCASSMYEVPETVERGGILYPKETVEVTFTVNPVLRINTIKEIKSLGKETEKIDIGQWQHGDEATTVIAKPKSALAVSDGLIRMSYDNGEKNNQVVANENGVTTVGDTTNINTDKLSIQSDDIDIQGKKLSNLIAESALETSNEHTAFNVDSIPTIDMILDRSNNMTQLNIQGNDITMPNGVIGQIKDQKSIPLREQNQQLITDGNCIDIITIDTDGIITITPSVSTGCPQDRRKIFSTNNWITPQVQSRNYIKVTVKQICDNCDDGHNIHGEYINYCPSCGKWNTLSDTGTSIRCSCGTSYCQNCGIGIHNTSLRLKPFEDNYVPAFGTTCKYCKDQLQSDTTKYYVNYCPDCGIWGALYQAERIEDDDTINILRCNSCNAEFCSTCGINQDKHGVTLTDNPVQYTAYKNAFRKLKYIKDGA